MNYVRFKLLLSSILIRSFQTRSILITVFSLLLPMIQSCEFTFILAVCGSGDVRRQLTLLFSQARAQKRQGRGRKRQQP